MSDALSAVCPVCDGGLGAMLPYPQRHARTFSIKFSAIWLCEDCGLGVAIPRHPQSALDAFYASGEYWGGVVAPARGQSLHESNQCKHRVARSLRYLGQRAGLRVLDVGAGHAWTADWLHALAPGKTAQFDFVEPDLARCADIQKRVDWCGIRRVEKLAAATGPYDLVFLNHVLEHVADPLDPLAQVERRLAPGAVAYIEVPNADYRIKQNVFPHTCFFTPDALTRLAARAGLTVIDCAVFGRQPAGFPTLPLRAAYRIAATAGPPALAGWIDDRLWRYRSAHEGLWIRCLISATA